MGDNFQATYDSTHLTNTAKSEPTETYSTEFTRWNWANFDFFQNLVRLANWITHRFLSFIHRVFHSLTIENWWSGMRLKFERFCSLNHTQTQSISLSSVNVLNTYFHIWAMVISLNPSSPDFGNTADHLILRYSMSIGWADINYARVFSQHYIL